VLLYEMLTGTWPFRGKTAVDVRHAVLHEEPLPLATARPDPVPPRLQQILDRALKKNPRDRYQQIRSFATTCAQWCAKWLAMTAARLSTKAVCRLRRVIWLKKSGGAGVRWFKSVTGAKRQAALPGASAGFAAARCSRNAADKLWRSRTQERRDHAFQEFG
jgi:hypothetical protein